VLTTKAELHRRQSARRRKHSTPTVSTLMGVNRTIDVYVQIDFVAGFKMYGTDGIVILVSAKMLEAPRSFLIRA